MTPIQLGNAVYNKRKAERLSLRALEAKTGVPASTLCDIEKAVRTPDVRTLARLSLWLNTRLSELLGLPSGEDGAVVYHPQASTPDIIAAHLRADVNLEPDKAALLTDLFRGMYERMAVQV